MYSTAISITAQLTCFLFHLTSFRLCLDNIFEASFKPSYRQSLVEARFRPRLIRHRFIDTFVHQQRSLAHLRFCFLQFCWYVLHAQQPIKRTVTTHFHFHLFFTYACLCSPSFRCFSVYCMRLDQKLLMGANRYEPKLITVVEGPGGRNMWNSFRR